MIPRILFVQTNYPVFLDHFYGENPGWETMSYKQIKQLWDKEQFGSGNFYSKNLSKYGWAADEIIINDPRLQSKWASENGLKVSFKESVLTKYIPESVKNLLGLRVWMKQIMFAQIKKMKPDVVYMHDLGVLDEKDIAHLKKYTKLVVGQIACPLPLNKKPLYSYDLIVSSFPHYVKMFSQWGIKSEYLRWCIDQDIPKNTPKTKRQYDVVYVGGLTPHHSQGNSLMEKLASEVHVDFWGYGETFLSPTSPIRKNFHGQAWGRHMYDIFSQAKIVVNRHINVAGNVANNMRLFESTGMGALLITDQKPNMTEFFKVGEEVVTYKNADDLIKKVKYYLTHEKQRLIIAAAGQKRTLRDHTYLVRMKELDTILRTYLQK